MANSEKFKKITADFEIITPMFLGDGLQQADSVRPTAVKGALRFWWRALMWPKLIKQFQTQESAITQLRRQEVDLFGAAVNGEGGDGNDHFGGQGQVSVRVFDTNEAVKQINNWPSEANSNSCYIAYGLLGDKTQGHKSAIQEGYQFTIQLIGKHLSEKQTQSLTDTLIMFGRLGSLGSRARRANGCVQILSINNENVQLDQANYERWLVQLFNQENTYPPFTALNKYCTARSLMVCRDARQAHGQLGGTYKRFRSGDNKKIKGRAKRALGTPLAGVDESRRASPVFLHVYKLDEGKFLPIMFIIPAQFQKNDGDNNSNMGNFYRAVYPLLLPSLSKGAC